MSNEIVYDQDKSNIKVADVLGSTNLEEKDRKDKLEPPSPERMSRRSSDFESRQKYYKKIVTKGKFHKTFLDTPSHILHANIFYISPIFSSEEHPQVGETSKKAKSWMTIISVWNTMIGSSLVSLPWAIRKAGIIPSIFLCVIYSLISFYTSFVIVKTGRNDKDYTDTISTYLGRWGKAGGVVYILFCNMINIGVIFIFFLIINQNLYPVLGFFINLFGANIDLDDGVPSFSHFSILYCGLIVVIMIYPLINLKEMNVIMKLNSYGIYFSSALLMFVLFYFVFSLTNTTFDFQLKINTTADSVRHLYLFGEDPLKLAGTLTLGLFCHSFILPIMKNNEKPENNKRDLFIGYVLVCLTYMSIGIAGYIAFNGSSFAPELTTNVDNWFKYFDSENGFILALKIMNVIQLLTILPVICYIVRVQLFGTIYGKVYPSTKIVYSFNMMLLILCMFVLYLCYNLLGRLMGIIGTFTGLFLVYLIPLLININYYYKKHPDKYIEISDLSYTSIDSLAVTNDKSFHEEILVEAKEDFKENQEVLLKAKTSTKKEKVSMPFREKVFYVFNVFLIMIGIFTLVTQFAPINIFGVHIR